MYTARVKKIQDTDYYKLTIIYESDNSEENIRAIRPRIDVIDVSGSMAGAPINQINDV